MKSFLKSTLATIVGIIISSLLLGLIFLIVIGGLISSESSNEIEPNSILHIQLNTQIKDRGSNDMLKNFDLVSMKPRTYLGLDDILANIKKAAEDDNIKGIYLELTSISAGLATVEEIRNALLKFKESDKFIISYSSYYTQSAYYLASVSDKIYLTHEGDLLFKGLGGEMLFFKGSLEKLGIEVKILRQGKFKAAIEPFILDKMSEENREQTKLYLSSFWNNILESISSSRDISVSDLNSFADSLVFMEDINAAVQSNMIDSLKYKDEIIAELKKAVEIEEDDKLNLVSLSKYTDIPEIEEEEEDEEYTRDKIGIIYAEGSIVSGNGSDENISAEKLSKEIRKARKNEKIKAIVLRINSPGGSALASEIIWREVDLASREKPVIASFGDVSASGGYYIACAADTIIASKNTITGSIGVFGILMNSEKFLNEKLGITVDRVTTNQNSDLGSMTRKLSAVEERVFQKSVKKVYETFINHVAEGRNMTTEEVDKIGQGRVWSGIDAKEIGLIDEFGGLEKAVEIAAEMANLENYRIISLPKSKNQMEQIMETLAGGDKTSLIKEHLGNEYKYFKIYNTLKNMKGIQTRLPYEIEIY